MVRSLIALQLMLPILFGNKSNRGVLIIEILISITIITIALVSLLSLAVFSLKASTITKQTLRANGLGQEAVEAVRSFRDRTDWDVDGLGTFTGDSNPYELNAFPPYVWELSLGTETIGIFTRKIVFEKVSRSSTDNIEDPYNPVNDDPDTRKVIVTVSWEDKEVEITTYFTNWR